MGLLWMSFRFMRSEAWLTSEEIAGEDGLWRAWLAVDGTGLIGKAVGYLSMMDLTISKQVSWRSWATSSLSLGLLGTRWVIKLSMAFVMRSGAMTASSQAT